MPRVSVESDADRPLEREKHLQTISDHLQNACAIWDTDVQPAALLPKDFLHHCTRYWESRSNFNMRTTLEICSMLSMWRHSPSGRYLFRVKFFKDRMKYNDLLWKNLLEDSIINFSRISFLFILRVYRICFDFINVFMEVEKTFGVFA